MLYKLTSTRVFRSYYGGANIDVVTGVDSPQNSRFPEDWLASVTEAFNPDRVVAGEGLSKTEDGKTLKDIIEANKTEMLGKDKEMKLLFKMLDAAERLAIQVHPTIPFAKKYFNSDYGKTECWYILNDRGSVYLGFKPGITKEYWQQLFDTQDVEGMLQALHYFQVKKGDMIFVAGGVPHAIGANCFIAELQEPTDLMVVSERITPSGVELPDVKLHGGLGFEKMMDCFVYEGMTEAEVRSKYFLKAEQIEEGRELLVGENITDRFRLEKITALSGHTFQMSNYGIVLVTKGRGEINGMKVKMGDRFFVPFEEKQLSLSEGIEILLCMAV